MPTRVRARASPSPVRGAAQAWEFVGALRGTPALQMLWESDRQDKGARSVFAEVRDVRGNLVHDAYTAILMREHGIREIYTRDTDFHRFPFLRVVDPPA